MQSKEDPATSKRIAYWLYSIAEDVVPLALDYSLLPVAKKQKLFLSKTNSSSIEKTLFPFYSDIQNLT